MSAAAVEMWYELGPTSPAFSWQVKQVELWSVPTSKYEPADGALCMLWQPAHSATPPLWKA
jgi:hypothetical protein